MSPTRASILALSCLLGACRTAALGGVARTGYAREVLADAPVAYWRFEEQSGSVAVDDSGYHRIGFYMNDPVLGASVGARHTGTGVLLQNESDGVFVEYATWTNLPAFAVEAWVRADRLATPEGMIIVDKGSTWNLFIDSEGRPAFQFPGDTPPETLAPTSVVVGGTYHLVGTFQDGAMKLYVNGALVSEARVPVTEVPSRETPIHVGRGLTPGRWEFEGVIDDVALYDGPLSAAAVLRHYNAGR